jgi:hypothetical protein
MLRLLLLTLIGCATAAPPNEQIGSCCAGCADPVEAELLTRIAHASAESALAAAELERLAIRIDELELDRLLADSTLLRIPTNLALYFHIPVELVPRMLVVRGGIQIARGREATIRIGAQACWTAADPAIVDVRETTETGWEPAVPALGDLAVVELGPGVAIIGADGSNWTSLISPDAVIARIVLSGQRPAAVGELGAAVREFRELVSRELDATRARQLAIAAAAADADRRAVATRSELDAYYATRSQASCVAAFAGDRAQPDCRAEPAVHAEYEDLEPFRSSTDGAYCAISGDCVDPSSASACAVFGCAP